MPKDSAPEFWAFSGKDLDEREVVPTNGPNKGIPTTPVHLSFAKSGKGKAENLNLAGQRLSLGAMVQWIDVTFAGPLANQRPVRAGTSRLVGPEDKWGPQPSQSILAWPDDIGAREEFASPTHRTELKSLYAIILALMEFGKVRAAPAPPPAAGCPVPEHSARSRSSCPRPRAGCPRPRRAAPGTDVAARSSTAMNCPSRSTRTRKVTSFSRERSGRPRPC